MGTWCPAVAIKASAFGAMDRNSKRCRPNRWSVAESYILSLSRHGNELAVGSSEGQVVILTVEGTSLQVKEELQVLGEVFGLSFFPNGDLAVAAADGSCTVWTRAVSRVASKTLRDDFASQAAAVAAAAAAAAPPTAAGGAATAGGTFDFNSTVEFGARKLTLSWNRGEDPQLVAERFLRENSLDSRHAGDVIAFVNQSMQQQTVSTMGGNKEFNYPVEVADGRRLTISWNRGENPQEVALNFARQHGGIAANELPDIVNFITQVSGSAAGPPAIPAVPAAMQQQLLQQVMSMGFPEPLARQALESSAWDVEAAVSRLLG
eukprot:symbB.v1.2.017913.t1/scaffold1404.1/size168536/8